MFARRCVYVCNRPQPVATVRNRSQPSGTVRNRPQKSARSPYGRAYGKFCRRGHFWTFHLWHCFVSRRKSFSVAGAILLRHFQKMCCSFRGRRSTLDVSIVILRGRPGAALQTCRVACFCESHCQGCVKWRQGANSVAGVAFCEM